jgi:NAD(P)-dependent dehydrogenase (short-subunit alcohol dehydrogenase family)
MERAGARIVAARADVSRFDQIAAVIDDIRRTMPPLAGIFHCAGVLDDATLAHQNPDRFSRVMAPKAAGALYLHTVTRDLPLDFFVLFSSIAGCLGSPGQANYAAANAFLDAFAHYRRSIGLPALSINWGTWAQTGMAARLGDGDLRRLADRGLGQMAPEDALQALGEMLSAPAAQMAVVPVDWPTFLAQFTPGTVPPLYAHMASASRTVDRATDWPARIAACAPGQRQQMLRGLVADEAIKAIGLDPARPLEADRSLYDAGLNSLIALDLTRALGACVARDLPATMLFNYSTVEAIACYLASEIFADEVESPPHVPSASMPSAAGVLRQIEELSDEDVDRLLEARARR